METEKRLCWICKTEYPLNREHFYKDSKDSKGFQKRCIECNKKTNKRYLNNNPEYFQDKSKERYEKVKEDNPNYNRDRYSLYREQYLKRRKDWCLSEYGRLYNLFDAARSRSKKKNIPFNLTMDSVIKMFDDQDGKCAITGIKLITDEPREANKNFYPYAPSIDKIDPEKGYVLYNIRIVAVIVNLSLNSFGDSVFDTMCKAYILKQYNITI
jgi:hypothetical protein